MRQLEYLTKEIKNVSLYGSRSQEGHISAIWALIQSLIKHGIAVSVEKKLASVLTESGYRLPLHGIKTLSGIDKGAQLAISIGGDGTFLRTACWLTGKEIPIMGINTGHLGFLAENSTDNIDQIVDLLHSGQLRIERRIVLEVECESLPSSDWPYALNEVAFLKGAASMIDVSVKVDGYHLATYRADGLLVATPTGSTAYNLSVGGPILAPTLKSIVLSPIAPHSLTLRPIVVSGDSNIEAEVVSRAKDFRLSIDGRSTSIPCGVPVKIRKASHDVLTLRKPDENFASTLQSKLLWGH